MQLITNTQSIERDRNRDIEAFSVWAEKRAGKDARFSAYTEKA